MKQRALLSVILCCLVAAQTVHAAQDSPTVAVEQMRQRLNEVENKLVAVEGVLRSSAAGSEARRAASTEYRTLETEKAKLQNSISLGETVQKTPHVLYVDPLNTY